MIHAIVTSAMLFLKKDTHAHMQTVLRVRVADAVSGQIHVVVKAVRTIYEINICKRNFYWQKEDRSPRSQLDSRKEWGDRGVRRRAEGGVKPRGRK